MRMNVLITRWHLQRGRVAVTPDLPPRRVLCSFNHSQPRHSPSMSCKVRCPAPKCRGSFPVGSWWVLRLYDLFSLCVMCRHFRGESWVFLLICSNPETGKQRLLSRTPVQEQPSSRTVHVWCDSVRDEGCSKLCLLGSSGLPWGRGAYLPGSVAASKVPVRILRGSRRLSLMQGLANFAVVFSYKPHAPSCSSQWKYLPALETGSLNSSPHRWFFFFLHFSHRCFLLVFQKLHVLGLLLLCSFKLGELPAREMERNVKSSLAD